MKHKFGLLPKVLLAIALGIVFGLFVPEWFTRIALTFNNIFGNFLNFVIPLLILGLVAPGDAVELIYEVIGRLFRYVDLMVRQDDRCALCSIALDQA